MEKTAILRKFLEGLPTRFDVATGDVQMNTVLLDIDEATGRAQAIERLRFRAD
jgi:2',3'-cyclic-nucleotide 2'-phosphodiesterase